MLAREQFNNTAGIAIRSMMQHKCRLQLNSMGVGAGHARRFVLLIEGHEQAAHGGLEGAGDELVAVVLDEGDFGIITGEDAAGEIGGDVLPIGSNAFRANQ